MARPVSVDAMRSALAQETNEVWVALLKITHPSISNIYLCDNTEAVTSNGQAYAAFPFSFTIPTDEQDQEPTVKLTISNVDRTLVDDIRAIQGGPVLWLSLVMRRTPNVVEYGPVRLKATAVTYTAEALQMTLGIDRLTGEPIPFLTFSPEYFPGLFT